MKVLTGAPCVCWLSLSGIVDMETSNFYSFLCENSEMFKFLSHDTYLLDGLHLTGTLRKLEQDGERQERAERRFLFLFLMCAASGWWWWRWRWRRGKLLTLDNVLVFIISGLLSQKLWYWMAVSWHDLDSCFSGIVSSWNLIFVLIYICSRLTDKMDGLFWADGQTLLWRKKLWSTQSDLNCVVTARDLKSHATS